MPTVVCPVCGTENASTRLFCRKCASDLHATVVLPSQTPPPPLPTQVPIRPIFIGGGIAPAPVLLRVVGLTAPNGATAPAPPPPPPPQRRPAPHPPGRERPRSRPEAHAPAGFVGPLPRDGAEPLAQSGEERRRLADGGAWSGPREPAVTDPPADVLAHELVCHHAQHEEVGHLVDDG